MEILLVLVTMSVLANVYLFLEVRKKKPKLDERVQSILDAVKTLDREGQALIHLEVINPDDVFLRSRGRA